MFAVTFVAAVVYLYLFVRSACEWTSAALGQSAVKTAGRRAEFCDINPRELARISERRVGTKLSSYYNATKLGVDMLRYRRNRVTA